MSTITADFALTAAQLDFWNREGYLIVRQLMNADEVREIKQNFDDLGAAGQGVASFWMPDLSPEAANDPLRRFPRVMHPHRWEKTGVAMRYMLHPRVHDILATLYSDEPIATQSMFYFKPPGARGQALHQDNLYLQVHPGTCIAAWTAIDRAVPENGGLYVVPGTHTMEIACPEVADAGESFTEHLVRVPKGRKAISLELNPGDTLFFNGSIVHGSPPNRTKDEWRRAFICHYMPKNAKHICKDYAPLYDFEGKVVTYDMTLEGGPCGKEFATVPYGATKWH